MNSGSMSPPAWGWPANFKILLRLGLDVPTRVGMARSPALHCCSRNRCPHPRGDGPQKPPRRQTALKMSPPAWGWPDAFSVTGEAAADVPTRVGMARPEFELAKIEERCPHPRGDGPTTPNLIRMSSSMSPPAWGWPANEILQMIESGDVPTRVGMARYLRTSSMSDMRCPHPRGDGP